MNRYDFVSNKINPIMVKKALCGTFYCALGYLPPQHEYRGRRAGSVSHRTLKQRKDRKMNLMPIAYKDKDELVDVLNEMIQFIKDKNIQ